MPMMRPCSVGMSACFSSSGSSSPLSSTCSPLSASPGHGTQAPLFGSPMPTIVANPMCAPMPMTSTATPATMMTATTTAGTGSLGAPTAAGVAPGNARQYGTYMTAARGGMPSSSRLGAGPGGRGSVIRDYSKHVQQFGRNSAVWARQMSHMQSNSGAQQYAVVRTAAGQTRCMPVRRVYGSVRAPDGETGEGDRARAVLAEELVPPPKTTASARELKKWDEGWVRAVLALPEEPVLSMLLAHTKRLMACKAHPLGEAFTKITADYAARALKVDVRGDDNVCEKMMVVIEPCVGALYPRLAKYYPELRAHEQWMQDGLFELMFQQLHHIIFPIYLKRHEEQDARYLSLFREFSDITPAHMSLPRRFWLTDAKTIEIGTPVDRMPYGDAVQALRQLDRMNSYLSKIQCLVEAGHAIYTSVEKYWEHRADKPEKLDVAADEFLPLFAYAIVKSQVCDVYSTLRLIEDFMTQADGSGEAGYYIVSFQSALSFIETLTKDDINKAFADAWGIPYTGPSASASAPASPAKASPQLQQQHNPVLAQTPPSILSFTAPPVSLAGTQPAPPPMMPMMPMMPMQTMPMQTMPMQAAPMPMQPAGYASWMNGNVAMMQMQPMHGMPPPPTQPAPRPPQ